MIAVAVSGVAQTQTFKEQHNTLERSLPGNLTPAMKHSGKLVKQVQPRSFKPTASSLAPATDRFSTVLPWRRRYGPSVQTKITSKKPESSCRFIESL